MACGVGAWLCGRGEQWRKIAEADGSPLGWGSGMFKPQWLGCQGNKKAGGGAGWVWRLTAEVRDRDFETGWREEKMQ